MAEIAKLQLLVDGQPAQQSIDKIGRNLADLDGKASRARFTMRGLLTDIRSFLVGAGVFYAFKQVIDTFAKFDQSMANVRAITRATASEMKNLSAQARELGAATTFSASEAGDAMEYLARAGFTVNQTMRAMPGLLDLAASDNLALAQAADIAANAIRGFNLEASESQRVADVLARGASVANTGVAELGDAMARVAPIAAKLNISMEEVAAMLAVMADAGIKGEMAGTMLRGMLANILQLQSPTAEVTMALERMGLSLDDVNIKTVPIIELFERLRAMGPSTANAIFEQRGFAGALAITQSLDRVKALRTEFLGAAGAAREVASVKMDSLNGSLEELKGIVEEIILSVADDGGLGSAFRGLVDSMTEGLRVLNANFGVIQSTIMLTIADIVDGFALVADTFNFVSEDMATAWSHLTEFLAQGVVGFQRAVETAWEGIKMVFRSGVTVINGIWAGFITAFMVGLEMIVQGWKKALDLMAKAPGPQREFLAFLSGEAAISIQELQRETGEYAKQADIVANLGKVWKESKEAVAEIDRRMDGISDSIAAVAASDREYFRTFSGQWSDWINSIKERIRMLAEGRVIELLKAPERAIIPSEATVPKAATEQSPERNLFNRFSLVGRSFSELQGTIGRLQAELNSVEWLSDASVEDVQRKTDEIAAAQEELVRQIKTGSVAMGEAFTFGFEEAVRSFGSLSQRMSESGAQIAESLDTHITQGFTDMITGAKSVEEAFANMANSIISDLIRIMVQQLIVRSALQFITGATGIPLTVAHAGGVMFQHAPRFHSGSTGVVGDEMPVIARRGEVVFTPDQLNALGNVMKQSGGGGGRNVEIINVVDPSVVDQRIAKSDGSIINIISRNKRAVRTVLGF